MKLVTKYTCGGQSVFRWHWHCLFGKCGGQLKPVLFKVLQDLFFLLKTLSRVYSNPFSEELASAGITCRLLSPHSFICLEVVSTWLPPQPGQHWARVFSGWTHWDFLQACCIPLLFSSQLKTHILILSFVTVLTCVSVHAQRSSKYYVGIVLEWRSEVLC